MRHRSTHPLSLLACLGLTFAAAAPAQRRAAADRDQYVDFEAKQALLDRAQRTLTASPWDYFSSPHYLVFFS